MIFKKSPNQSGRIGHKPSMIVIHADAGTTDAGTVDWISRAESRVSYHYLVGRDGEIYQFVNEDRKAWHSGKSFWDGFTNVNEISVGVSFANNGSEPYRQVQYEEGGWLVADICERHNIPAHRIRAHSEVSPGRKTDPYEHFDWSAFLLEYALESRERQP